MKTFLSKYGDIYLGSAEEGLKTTIDGLTPSSIIIIADSHTAVACVPLITKIIGSQSEVVIAPGDQHKSYASCQTIWSYMLEVGADRSCLVLNIGGGMICDLGGFAASCYKRGVRFGHIPTSLLAMTDAAIGGKTGINHAGYKNLIGQFEIPSFIWIDPDFLKTLPYQELSDGMAEVIKHAIVGSKALWDLLSEIPDLDSINWLDLIAQSTRVKQQVVELDPFEKGARKALNYGHTIGHALESHYLNIKQPMPHGQAITLGMLAETRIAHQLGLLKIEDFQRIITLIMRLLRPSEVTLPQIEQVQHWLLGDKKKINGRLGYSLPESIGSCRWDVMVEDRFIAESLNWLAAHLSTTSKR